MKANDNEILTIAGKRVRVEYTDGISECCQKCCFNDDNECIKIALHSGSLPCKKFDFSTAYFVEAEQPEEAPARPANPFIPDQGLTIDGKLYVKRYFRIGDACSRCAFKVGEDAKGHACCKDHGKPEKPCTPDREKGVLVYFTAAEADVDKWVVTNAFLHCEKAGKIVSEMYGDKFDNQRNRNKYLAFLQQVNLDDRFGELAKILQRYGAMPALKEQPVSDLEAEIERYESEIHGFESSSRADCLNIARHFAEWGAEHLRK